MGPYCKFCVNRCFVPTTEEDLKNGYAYSLKATCSKGMKFDAIKNQSRKVANDVLNEQMGLAEASRFLAALAEELEELKAS